MAYRCLGNVFLALLFFAASAVCTFGVSNEVCVFAVHYIDGMFLGSLFMLLAVMMVYKFWDSITAEDLEFAIGGSPHVWHLHNTMGIEKPRNIS